MYQSIKWNLKDLIKNPKDIDKILNKTRLLVKKVETYKKKLNPFLSEKDFISIIKLIEEIKENSSLVSQFPSLWTSADVKSQEAKALESKIDDILTGFDNKLIFFSLWWKDLDTKNAKRLMKNAEEYRYYLKLSRQLKPYTLTEAEEKIINIKDSTGSGTLVDLYEMLKTGFKYRFEGKNQTESELSIYVRNKNPKKRELAYKLLLEKYKEYDSELGYIYQTVIRDYKNECITLRGYKSPLTVRNISNDLPDNVIDTLLKVCKKNVTIFQKYFKLKAKLMKLKKMNRYHLYAPAGKAERKYGFDEAVILTLDSYKKFSPEIEKLIRKVLDEKHLDSELRLTKKSGAFCASIRPKDTPYVLMNYTGTARDVATLAHELGHAAHSMLASSQNIFAFHPVLPLAETASVFGEMLLSESLIEHETNRSIKIHMLCSKLDDIYATIARQIFFTIFEKDAHEAVANGATVKELCEIYLKNLKEQFGNAVNVPKDFKYEWLYVPHIFFSPFYCYAYAFGNLMVFALYEMYKKEGKSFIPKYIRMLSQGGSMPPIKILHELGINPASEKFWQQGFDYVAQQVDELEKLIK